MAKYKNTLQKGSVRYIVFKEGESWYAAGLEFNIVESGDSPQEAILLLFEALSGYLESAKRVKARPNILNQKVDPEYEEMWQNIREKNLARTSRIYTSGEFNLKQPMERCLVPA